LRPAPKPSPPALSGITCFLTCRTGVIVSVSTRTRATLRIQTIIWTCSPARSGK
jgi:hypothetical protein